MSNLPTQINKVEGQQQIEPSNQIKAIECTLTTTTTENDNHPLCEEI